MALKISWRHFMNNSRAQMVWSSYSALSYTLCCQFHVESPYSLFSPWGCIEVLACYYSLSICPTNEGQAAVGPGYHGMQGFRSPSKDFRSHQQVIVRGPPNLGPPMFP